MKTLVTIIVHLLIGLLVANAQTTSTTSSTSSTKITVSNCSETKEDNYYRSFSIIDMEDNFKIKVKFMNSKKNLVKAYLIEQFGEEKMISDADAYLWKKEIDKEEIYEIELKENKLRINVDKELASDKLLKKFTEIGKELKSLTSKKV